MLLINIMIHNLFIIYMQKHYEPTNADIHLLVLTTNE